MSAPAWKPHPSHSGLEVSDFGGVRKNGSPKKVFFSGTGVYPCVSINKKPVLVHRLVLETFVGPPPFKGAHCRHLDGDPSNNSLNNLTWGTPKENGEDRVRHGRVPKGEAAGASKLTNAQVEEIRRRRAAMEKLKDLASEFGVSISTISQITRGRSRPYEGGPVLKVGVRVNAKEMKKRGSKNAERDERVVRLFRTEGRTPTEIAECCGLTRQRISQILKERAR